eukprot:2852375-Rhodomonas_salina.1
MRLRPEEEKYGHDTEIRTTRGRRWRWRAMNTGQRADSQYRQPGVVISQNLKGAGIPSIMQTVTTILTHTDPDVLLLQEANIGRGIERLRQQIRRSWREWA